MLLPARSPDAMLRMDGVTDSDVVGSTGLPSQGLQDCAAVAAAALDLSLRVLLPPCLFAPHSAFGA